MSTNSTNPSAEKEIKAEEEEFQVELLSED